MKRVTVIGEVFFRRADPEKTAEWYERHLGVPKEGLFRAGAGDATAWAVFQKKTSYFGPNARQYMVNYPVDDLDPLLDALRTEGVEIDPKRHDVDYGRFAWIAGCDGNRGELWQPLTKKA